MLAIFAENSIDTPAAIWGCHWAGGVVCLVNPGYGVGELAWQLRDSEAKGVVTLRKFLGECVFLSVSGLKSIEFW